MFNLNISKRERYIVMATAITIASALLYNFMFEPMLQKWAGLNNEIVVKRARIRKGLQLLKNKDKIITEYNTHVPSAKNISKILNYIEKLSESMGIKTANIKPKAPVEKDFYKEYTIEVQIEGEFSDINKFVSELIKSPLYISVERFDFRTVKNTASKLKGTLILSKLSI